MSFHEVRFPAALSVGSSGGPERRTQIVTLNSGFEERNSPWAHSRRHYDAGLGVRSLDELAEVIAFFEARHGQLYGFRWKDWTDYKSCAPSAKPSESDQLIGAGDGVTHEYSLVKFYKSGSNAYGRPIKKPVNGTVLVKCGEYIVTEGVDYTVDYTNGVIRFSAPPGDGQVISAGFEFDVPVRFDTDQIRTNICGLSSGEILSIPIIELKV